MQDACVANERQRGMGRKAREACIALFEHILGPWNFRKVRRVLLCFACNEGLTAIQMCDRQARVAAA